MSELQQADTPPASPAPADQPQTTVDTPRSTQTDTHRSAEPDDPYAPAFDPPDSADRAPAEDTADHDPYAPVFDPLGDPADQAPDSPDTTAAGPDDADGYDPMAHLDLGAWDPTDWINGPDASGATTTDATQARPAPDPPNGSHASTADAATSHPAATGTGSEHHDGRQAAGPVAATPDDPPVEPVSDTDVGQPSPASAERDGPGQHGAQPSDEDVAAEPLGNGHLGAAATDHPTAQDGADKAAPHARADADQTAPRDTGAESGAAHEVMRYTVDDLRPSGVRDLTYGQELLTGPDGRSHFVGDREGTWRDQRGKPHDAAGYVTDDNLPPTKDMQARAERDLSGVRAYRPDGPDAVDEALRQARAERQDIAEGREQLWAERLQPLADRLDACGCPVDRATFGQRFYEIRDAANEFLDPVEALEFTAAGRDYINAGDRLRAASERLGAAGGDLVAAREFPDGRTVSGGDGTPGTPGNLDRIILVTGPDPAIIAFEEKGVGGGLGSRLVDHPTDPDAARHRAEQGSTDYLRHMLVHDTKLAAALRDNPQLQATIQATINGSNPGEVRYLLVHTAADGRVTVTDFKIDPDRLNRDTLAVAANPDTQEER